MKTMVLVALLLCACGGAVSSGDDAGPTDDEASADVAVPPVSGGDDAGDAAVDAPLDVAHVAPFCVVGDAAVGCEVGWFCGPVDASYACSVPGCPSGAACELPDGAAGIVTSSVGP